MEYIRYMRDGSTEKRTIVGNARRTRNGKTAKDHASGAWKQRLTNRANRAQIIRETKWDRPLPAVL